MGASPGREAAGLQPLEGGSVGGVGNTRAAPSTLPVDHENGASPPTRDLNEEGAGATTAAAAANASGSVGAAIAMEMDVEDPAKEGEERVVTGGEPVNGVLNDMALRDGGGEQAHVAAAATPMVDVGGGEGEELAPPPVGGCPVTGVP